MVLFVILINAKANKTFFSYQTDMKKCELIYSKETVINIKKNKINKPKLNNSITNVYF
jgi:hypothetical protein